MSTQKTIIKQPRQPRQPRRKALHNPRATDAASCTCPACRAYRTAEGEGRAADYNGWAATKGARFSIILTGDALAPRFRSGDTLAVEPDRQPQPGDAVLAHFDGNPKKKGVMLLNGDEDLTDMRGAWVPRGCYAIDGVIVGRHPAPRV